MTNIAQMVNVLQAMVQTRQDRLVLTPTYYAFEMHVPFQDATFVPVVLQDNPAYALDGVEMPQLSASAARGADGRLVLSLVNANPREALELDLRVGGQAARAVQGRVLTAAAMDAENGFDQPAQVLPRPIEARVRDGRLTLSVPAKSVVVLTVEP
jgi:alpha-N-arabinofuranosidase